MIVPRFIAGFSGHRHLPPTADLGASLENCLARLDSLARAAGGVLDLCSSITYGADLVAVEAARKLGLAVHLILPKPVIHDAASGQVRLDAGFAGDFWDDAGNGMEKSFRQRDWERAWQQIQDAQAGVGGGTLRVVHGCHTEPECYYDTGMQILEACDVFLAVWDGLPAQGLGGTGQLVERAGADHPPRPLLIVDPATGKITERNLADFALPDEVQVQKVNHLNELMEKCQPGVSPASPAEIIKCLDDAAVDTSRKFRSSVVKAICCQGLATVVAAVAIVLPRSASWALFVLAVLEMGLVTWALFFTRIQSWRHTHQQWMRARFGAELGRGLGVSTFFLDPLNPQIVRHAPAWRRFALSMALLSMPRGADRLLPWEHWRDLYVKNRLAGQILFFQEKHIAAGSLWRRTRAAGRWATWLAPPFVLIAMLAKGWHVLYQPPHQAPFSWPGLGMDVLVKLMPILVPLVAGMAAGLNASLDITRRSYRYDELAARLQSVEAQLIATKTGTSARRLVQATEEILLDELIEWRLAERQNGAH